MREKDIAVGVRTNASEVAIVERRLDALVDGGVKSDISKTVGKSAVSIRIPCHSESVHIEESVSLGDLGFGRRFCMDFWVMGEELWQVMFVNLLAEGVCRSDEHIFEERWLRCGNVSKPAAHSSKSTKKVLKKVDVSPSINR